MTPPAKRLGGRSASVKRPFKMAARRVVRDSADEEHSYDRNKLTFAVKSRGRFSNKSFPFYRQPREIGSYSVDGMRTVFQDDRNRKYYYCHPKEGQDVHFDLSADYDRTVKRNVPNDEKLDGLLRWIVANIDNVVHKVKSPGDNCYSLQTDFVCFRGLLTKLLCTPYENREGWIVCATRFNNTVYLYSFDTDEDIKRKANATPREELMTSWGYKFETYVTSGTPGGVPNVQEPVNENEEFCVVFRTRLQEHSIILGAEVDCEDIASRSGESSTYFELKTSREFSSDRQYQNFQRFKLHKWWAQSFLAGIPKIVCGFRGDDGIVRRLQEFQTSQLPKLAEGMWDAALCFNFCKEFLAFVKHSVTRDDPTIVYKFEWRPGQDVHGSVLEPNSRFQILPDWYIERWKHLNKQ